MHPMLTIAVRAARAAGNVISLNFDDSTNVSVQEKSKNDLVTNVDRECEKLICETCRTQAYERRDLIFV